MRLLNWRAEENLVINNKDNIQCLCLGTNGLIVVSWKFGGLKTSTFLIEALQCRRILGALVYIFVLGHHLGFVTVEDWVAEIFAEGVGVKWKNGQGGGGGEEKRY